MANSKYAYLGTAEKYPTQVTNAGSIELVSGPDVIMQSIRRALETGLGTVFFNRSMGSRMKQAQYEQNDDMLKSMLDLFIDETIQNHEPRVQYINTDYVFKTENEKSWVQCTINVRILQSNEFEATVWPFYRQQ